MASAGGGAQRDETTLIEEVKGGISNLILVLAWTSPMFFLPLSVVLIMKGHGALAIAVGFVLMGMLLGGPQSFGYRIGLYSVFVFCAYACPAASRSQASFGVFLLGLMLASITNIPGRPKKWAPKPAVWRLLTKTMDGRKYYRRMELTGALDDIKPGKNLFATHPHGILTAGWTWNMFWNSDFHERTGRIGFLIDEGLRLKAPTFRLVCDWHESKNCYCAAATKGEFKAAMDRGDSLALLPGGFQEATICERGKDRVYIKNRLGFIKYCLQGGYKVTPVYHFGESETYSTFGGLLKQRLWLAKQNIPACAMFGNALCPLLPRRKVSVISAVGKPLELPQIAEPTAAEVAKWHGKYMDALKETFDKHKAEAGRPDAVLELW
eukprot:TRINITY_DN90711_c0_g1_i1.p1 TRINITY_DN90711_c0_g1~~TRINITY_DN90711_c0_g1_i1.p1  ORF type:complete len:380 (+),score=63.31 TRINITY_DN90711_c0_g1_i1:35-1174(+)